MPKPVSEMSAWLPLSPSRPSHMFNALITPMVAKIVKGMARRPSCRVLPANVISPRSDSTTFAPKIIASAATAWARKRTSGDSSTKSSITPDPDQQHAAQQETQHFRGAGGQPGHARYETCHGNGDKYRQPANERNRSLMALARIRKVDEPDRHGNRPQYDDQHGCHDAGQEDCQNRCHGRVS